jgi:hypothetical protein
MNNNIDLKELIKNDKDARCNRDGYTPLFSLAEDIAKKRRDIPIESLILKLDLSPFDFHELSILNTFISHTEIETDKILEKYLQFIKENLETKSEDRIIGRGVLSHFIIYKNVELISFSEIKNDAKLKETAPWIWIDCVSYYKDWKFVDEAISERLKHNEFKYFLFRLPALNEKFENDLETSLYKWYNMINQSDKSDLVKWLERFGITFDISKAEFVHVSEL